ncbi:unnamed protein product, partial [Prorocentrum cordatum]
FGILADKLRHVSKYWWRASDSSPWRQLTYQQLLEMGERQPPTHGVLQVLAKDTTVAWCRLSNAGGSVLPVVQCGAVATPPRFLSGSDASTLAEALFVDTLEDLRISSILDMTRSVPLVAVSCMGDLDSGNVRAKQWLADLVNSTNVMSLARSSGARGVALLLDNNCASHILNVAADRAFGGKKLLPQLHSVSVTFNLGSQYKGFRQALDAVAKADLRAGVGFFPGQMPPPRLQNRNRRVLDGTLLRGLSTRGGAAVVGDLDRERLDLAESLLKFFNGDWTKNCLHHWCWEPGCCNGRSPEVAMSRAAGLLEKVILQPISQRVPALNRWHTWGPACEGVALGAFLHRILPRIVGSCGIDNDRDDGAAEEGDSWTEYNNKKARQCSEYLGSDDLLRQIGLAVIASEPLDRLSNRLQHLDKVGNVLADILGRDNGCLGDCQRRFYYLLHRHLDPGGLGCDRTTWPISLMIEYSEESECEGLLDEMLSSVMYLSSQVWARLE